MNRLDDVKALLDLSSTHEQDDKIIAILDSVESRLKLLLKGVEEIPDELSYIVLEVAVSRFNRIGSEGYSSHSIEGETVNFSTDDFLPYMDDIKDWLELQKKSQNARRGRLVWL